MQHLGNGKLNSDLIQWSGFSHWPSPADEFHAGDFHSITLDDVGDRPINLYKTTGSFSSRTDTVYPRVFLMKRIVPHLPPPAIGSVWRHDDSDMFKAFVGAPKNGHHDLVIVSCEGGQVSCNFAADCELNRDGGFMRFNDIFVFYTSCELVWREDE